MPQVPLIDEQVPLNPPTETPNLAMLAGFLNICDYNQR